jgi:hypothetical protein
MYRRQEFKLSPAYDCFFREVRQYNSELYEQTANIRDHSFQLKKLFQGSKQVKANSLKPTAVIVHGGWIRDKLLGNYSDDLDILTPLSVIDDLIEFLQTEADGEFTIEKTVDLSFDNLKGCKLCIGKFVFKGEEIGIDLLGMKQPPLKALKNQMVTKDFTFNSFFYDF